MALPSPGALESLGNVVPPVALPSPLDVSFPADVSSLPADLPPLATAQDANAGLPGSTPSPATVPKAAIEQPVDTLGGRVYMTNVTLAGHPYTLILDTGSSDTWIAASGFTCTSRLSHARLPQESCGFGELYDVVDSTTYNPIPGRVFGVKYSDGEYLMGEMGVEELRMGDVDGSKGGLTVRQTIGVVERGWWMGDGRSSGLMGLAFPTLASNYHDLNYTTVVGSLFETHQVPPLFSLALSRPTPQSPTAGGLLAIGGIPDVPYTPPFVRVPITPVLAHTYAFYTIPVDGFAITPPSGPATVPVANMTSSTVSGTSQRAHRQDGAAPLQMILDSGSTLLYLPDATADYLASLFSPPARYVPSSNTYITSCRAQQPRFGVVIGGTTFYINPEDMLTREGRGRCSLAVQRMEEGDAVLGDAWMKNVLVVFDLRPEGEGMGVWIAAREVY
ncbi:acid protease [Paraphaeosphaeria sporulosa]|uniref:Acid protease n=1 Tax=Paraphaeosphaeria sporulosa TaxID=1460663 RepID=A0A177C002_9PLEO|nr:acid protease [Paraphaeosphaeria sporulosa]OAG00138.1 acid protease [Paraphaeosphaeria sporulosa]